VVRDKGPLARYGTGPCRKEAVHAIRHTRVFGPQVLLGDPQGLLADTYRPVISSIPVKPFGPLAGLLPERLDPVCRGPASVRHGKERLEGEALKRLEADPGLPRALRQ